MRKANIFLAGLVALTMAGCQEVPEDVKSRTEERNSAVEEAKNNPERTGEIKFISPSEVEADAEVGLAQTYSNFTLAKGIKVEVPDTIFKCDFKQITGFNAKTEALCEKILGKEIAESGLIETSQPNPDLTYKVEGKGFRDDAKKLHFVTWNNGFLCFMKNDMFDTVGDGGQRVEIYHVDRGDDLSDVYTLGDKDVSVAEAVEAAQKWLDENYAELEPDYDVRVRTVIARQDDYGAYSYDITAYRFYKGVSIDELTFIYYKEDDKKDRMKYRDYGLELVMSNGTDIDYLTNLAGIVAPIEKGTLDKIVSVKSALEHIEKTFADFENPLVINDINLKYVMTPDYNPSPETAMSYMEENVMNTGHLVWEFIMDVSVDQVIRDGNSSGTIGNPRKYIYINAETGELEFDFSYNLR